MKERYRYEHRSEALAARLDVGVEALAAFVATVNETEWQTRVPNDGRKIGVVVHRVLSMYPIEMQLAQVLAAGRPVTGVTWDGIDAINRDHAQQNDAVAKEAALALLASNSAAPLSLNSDAPLACQFFLEDHPVRDSYHHLARMRAALSR